MQAAYQVRAGHVGVWLPALLLACLLALSGCGGGREQGSAALLTAPARYYSPPGPPDDPWGPYIQQAAGRFAIPGQWVRAVMKQESAGQQQAVSPVGAIGLMQLMPATYAGLRDQYGLGNDPFEPHDNIMAGSGYIRQMYDRFGAPGFLAAYNAGPTRLQDYLQAGEALPDETVNYLAKIAPNLGPDTQLTGPLARYAGMRTAAATPTQRSFAAGCDPDVAYDPDRPCRTLEAQAAEPAPEVPVAAPAMVQEPVEQAPGETLPEAPVYRPPPAPRVYAGAGTWAIQVGAFTSSDLARAMAARAQAEAADFLAAASIAVPTTTPLGGQVLYRARLADLSQTMASLACRALNAHQLPCIVVRPGV